MKKFITSTAVLGLTVLTAVGQQVIGLTASGGVSYFKTDMKSSETVQKFYFSPSGHGGLFYDYHFKDKYSIGTEVLFIQIEGREHSTTPETDALGNPNGLYITSDTWRHISYWGIPILFGYSDKKISVNFGFQINIAQQSSAHYKTVFPYNGGVSYSDNKADGLPIDNYDYGLTARVSYNLTKKFSIQTAYYFGMNNIYWGKDIKWTVQQLTVGLRYNLSSHGQTDKAEK